jgi:hypothetical protein
MGGNEWVHDEWRYFDCSPMSSDDAMMSKMFCHVATSAAMSVNPFPHGTMVVRVVSVFVSRNLGSESAVRLQTEYNSAQLRSKLCSIRWSIRWVGGLSNRG